MSAPTPSTRLALSFTMPMAKTHHQNDHGHFNGHGQHAHNGANGPVQDVGNDQLIYQRGFSLLCRAQIDQFRSVRLFQIEFFRPKGWLNVAFSMVRVTCNRLRAGSI